MNPPLQHLPLTYWKTALPLDTPGTDENGEYVDKVPMQVETEEEATLVGSLIKGTSNLHLPVLDIDMPCTLIESSTPGHAHLIISKTMKWEPYQKLLLALMEAGIIEEGYYHASIRDGGTFIRKPGLKKEAF